MEPKKFLLFLIRSCAIVASNFPHGKPNKFGAGIVNAEKVLAAPLPDNITRSIIAPAQALEQHPAIDNGRLDTFTHLFDAQLFDSQEKANFIQVAEDNNKLQVCLAKLLQTTETQLARTIERSGTRASFLFCDKPELYQQLAEALSSEQLEPNQLKTRSLIESSKPNNLDSVREHIVAECV
jgi:hypothetical protein